MRPPVVAAKRSTVPERSVTKTELCDAAGDPRGESAELISDAQSPEPVVASNARASRSVKPATATPSATVIAEPDVSCFCAKIHFCWPLFSFTARIVAFPWESSRLAV